MITRNLILILSNLPWEWTTDYINQTAYQISKHNIVLCHFWLEALSLKEHIIKRKRIRLLYKISSTIYCYESIHFFPFRRIPIISWINLYINLLIVHLISWWLTTKYHLKQKIVWVFDPRLTKLAFFFKNRGFFLLYDCVDYWVGSELDTNEATKIMHDENQLLKESNLVVVNSQVLQKIHKTARPNITVVPQGFRLDSFRKTSSRSSSSMPTRKPILGYIGGINYRLDFPLLEKLAKRNPEWNIVFVGPKHDIGNDKVIIKTKRSFQRLLQYENVHHFSSVSKSNIPDVIRLFDVGIIPYDTTLLWNKYSFPMKLFEYFYCGIPTVSTPIEELKRFPKYVKIGSTEQEWEKYIKELLSKPWPKKYIEAQRRLARENSWEKKVRAITEYSI